MNSEWLGTFTHPPLRPVRGPSRQALILAAKDKISDCEIDIVFMEPSPTLGAVHLVNFSNRIPRKRRHDGYVFGRFPLASEEKVTRQQLSR
jgi:hypothetical protein